MTPRLRVTGKEVITALQRAGFEVTRSRGSHRFLRHSDGRVTTVPVHSGETIGPGLLSKSSEARSSRERSSNNSSRAESRDPPDWERNHDRTSTGTLPVDGIAMVHSWCK
jgi:predicted RNA binding protein YcfA (HicA-like mRNA interferase family)